MPGPAEEMNIALIRFESVILDMTRHVLVLDDIVRRLPVETDAVSVERDTAWARGLYDLLRKCSFQVGECEIAFGIMRRFLNADQLVRLQRCRELYDLLTKRSNQIQGAVLSAIAGAS